MITNNHYRWPVIAALLAASFSFAHLCFLSSAFQPWNLQTTDLLFDIRDSLEATRPQYDPIVAYVDITDSSGTKIGSPYLERSQYARFIRNLAETKAALQVHDTIFRAPLPDEAQNQQLVDATRASDNVVLGFIARAREAIEDGPQTIEGAAESVPKIYKTVRNFQDLAAAARREAFIDVEPDIDGVFRRTPLVMRGADGGLQLSLGLAAACIHLGISDEQIVIKPGHSIRLGEKVEIPIDAVGNMRVNYIGPWEAMDHYHFEDVYLASEDELKVERLTDELQNRILVVADVTTDVGDVGPSPFDANYPLAGIHANVIHSIISGQLLREFGWKGMLPIELLLMCCIFFLARQRSTAMFLSGSAAVLLGFLASALLLFLYGGTIFHLVRPPLMVVGGVVSTLVYRYTVGERARAVVQATFEAYFPPNLVRRFVSQPELLTTEGRRATLTILFSDIQGFTSRSATMDPADVQEMLNDYFAEMVDIVFDHGGTLDKFIGDGLMVFFGDPEEQPDHADRAVKTAIAMQRRLREINQQHEQQDKEPLIVRIGINTGEVLVGNMGSARRLSYTVLGSAVNLAARVEPAAPPGGVLISQNTKEALTGEFSMRAVDPIDAKGFAEPIPVHEVDI